MAFPFAPLFRVASTELKRLVEMHADDTAAKAQDRRVLATALIELAAGRAPSAVSAPAALQRRFAYAHSLRPPIG